MHASPLKQAATLRAEPTPSAVVLRIGGDVDSATVPDLQARIVPVLAATSGPVVLDLSGITFLSSAGLRLLLDLQRELDGEDRPLRMVTGDVRAVLRPLHVTGLDRELTLYPDLASALA